MSEAGFTKGPWKSHDHDEMDIVSESESFVGICTVYGYDPDHTGFNVSDECSANAHLIASAPEMYAMLEKLSGQLTDINAHRAADEVESLLAKARGEV